jgi:hypothetical protein
MHVMGIEHRWNERQATDHNVLIKVREQGLRQARIRNISSSGVFIELPLTAPLSNNSRVELIFVRSTNRIARILRIPALVVRTNQSGAGLMFFDSSPAAFRTLLAFLLADKKQVPQRSRMMQESARLEAIQRLASAMPQLIHKTGVGLDDSPSDRTKVTDEQFTQGARHE